MGREGKRGEEKEEKKEKGNAVFRGVFVDIRLSRRTFFFIFFAFSVLVDGNLHSLSIRVFWMSVLATTGPSADDLKVERIGVFLRDTVDQKNPKKAFKAY